MTTNNNSNTTSVYNNNNDTLDNVNDSDTSNDNGTDEGKEPLLISSLMNVSLTYAKLFLWMKHVRIGGEQVNDNDPPQQPPPIKTSQILPNELILRILEYVTIYRVKHEYVTILSFSSRDGNHPLSSVLNDDESSWWISASSNATNQPTSSLPQQPERQPEQQQSEQQQPQQRNVGKKRKGEYIEFLLVPQNDCTIKTTTPQRPSLQQQQRHSTQSMCRLTKVSIKIPPMPIGPLSVAEFHLERKKKVMSNHNNDNKNHEGNDDDNEDHEWYQFTPSYMVENRIGYQSFIICETLRQNRHLRHDDDDNDVKVGGCDIVVNRYVDVDRVRVVCTKNQLYRMMYQHIQDQRRSPGPPNVTHNLDEFSQVGYYSIRFD